MTHHRNKTVNNAMDFSEDCFGGGAENIGCWVSHAFILKNPVDP
jgi:hypothetical protein